MCSCGLPTRPNINHRQRIPCWSYIGQKRVNVTETRESLINSLRPEDLIYCERIGKGDEGRPVTMTVAKVIDECVYAYDPHWGDKGHPRDVTHRLIDLAKRATW